MLGRSPATCEKGAVVNVYLSHGTALEYWRRHPASPRYRTVLRGRGIDDCVARTFDIAEMDIQRWVTPPFEVLVSNRGSRRRSNLLVCHVCSKPLPEGSFVKVSRNVAVSSPELCFVQMASTLSMPRLVLLGYELCGLYVLRSQGQNGFISCEPLTSTKSLRSYLDCAGSLDGVKKARRALDYVTDFSASPAETQLAALLCMPTCQGGYGIDLPCLNQAVALGSLSARESGRSLCRCDLYWPEARLCVEYNSDAHHTGSERIASDAIRTNALLNEGVTVIVVTREQLYDPVLFDDVAQIVARQLGMRLRVRFRDFDARRAGLRREILG